MCLTTFECKHWFPVVFINAVFLVMYILRIKPTASRDHPTSYGGGYFFSSLTSLTPHSSCSYSDYHPVQRAAVKQAFFLKTDLLI